MQLRAIDFFCGAGGFSEGFRQQGFKIVMGVDNWRPAIETHNLNHGLNDTVRDILEFEKSIDVINALPNTEIIIGSPPCVNFSMANKAGKADKSLGVRLIEAYLRVVAVKKHQPNSILKAWLMENVPNSRNWVQEVYTFKDLGLGDWAKSVGKKPNDEALRAKDNGGLFVAADYGSPQSRQRFICGEIVSTGEFPSPIVTHGVDKPRRHVTLQDIKKNMPSPISKDSSSFSDPNYPELVLSKDELTDHFYDTGLYMVEWEMAKFAKTNHPYMGRMSFPEDESKPCRTIMATRSASTREALIFPSEINRVGDGQYRLPTIREASTLMGFPYTYQFVGGEGSKWKQIGNAVCPHMSAALAKEIRVRLNLPPIRALDFSDQTESYKLVNNLNSSTIANFNAPPKKKNGAKFRMHPFKDGNMTVALTNFDARSEPSPETNGKKWYCSVFLGSGKEFEVVNITSSTRKAIEAFLHSKMKGDSQKFMIEFAQEFDGKIGSPKKLQELLEANVSRESDILSPIQLVNEIKSFIEKYDTEKEVYEDARISNLPKNRIPKRQLMAMWAISKIVS
ncbi:MAG: DNA cytosine methyltransferase [Anaerolineae bacterium]|nr:DNA cytosine methyltransferase [Anaerolineae bacterium]